LAKKCIFTEKRLILESIHQFKFKDINGKEVDFRSFAGRKVMLVNVASRCGYTPQYKQLQALYEAYSDTLMIVGFPANDFGAQEPGSDDEIREFCSTVYGVTFPLAAKCAVTGPQAHLVFKWIGEQGDLCGKDCRPSWNFHKFLFDEMGILSNCFPASIDPIDPLITEWITASSSS